MATKKLSKTISAVKNIFSKSSIHDEIATAAYNTTYFHDLSKPKWFTRNYTKFADEAYSKNVIAHRSISMIAKSVAMLKWKLNFEGNEISEHPILKLLCKPNPTENGKLFIESMISYRMISGNAFILAIKNGEGEVKELYNLRPDRVSIITDKNGFISAYSYKTGDREIRYPVGGSEHNSHIYHFKNFNPLNDHLGLSAVEAAAYSIDQHNNAARWNQSLLQNGAKPSGALVVQNDKSGNTGNLTDEQFMRVKSQIEEQFMGYENAGKPILLEGGLDWKEMSITPKDMDFIEAKHTAAREIALAFGVPPQLLGIPGDNTYSNLAEARLALWEQTIIPHIEEIITAFNNWLVPNFKHGVKLQLSHNVDDLPALMPRRDKLWEKICAADFLSEEEKREILGLKKVN